MYYDSDSSDSSDTDSVSLDMRMATISEHIKTPRNNVVPVVGGVSKPRFWKKKVTVIPFPTCAQVMRSMENWTNSGVVDAGAEWINEYAQLPPYMLKQMATDITFMPVERQAYFIKDFCKPAQGCTYIQGEEWEMDLDKIPTIGHWAIFQYVAKGHNP